MFSSHYYDLHKIKPNCEFGKNHENQFLPFFLSAWFFYYHYSTFCHVFIHFTNHFCAISFHFLDPWYKSSVNYSPTNVTIYTEKNGLHVHVFKRSLENSISLPLWLLCAIKVFFFIALGSIISLTLIVWRIGGLIKQLLGFWRWA